MGKKYQLPKEFATKWVDALRSTTEKQGFTQYHNPLTGCYCGMGIGYLANGYRFDKDGSNLVNKTPISSDLFWAIVKLNDDLILPFTKQADWIEANVEFI